MLKRHLHLIEVGSTKHENNWYVITREKMIHAARKTSYCTANSIAIMMIVKFRNKTTQFLKLFLFFSVGT